MTAKALPAPGNFDFLRNFQNGSVPKDKGSDTNEKDEVTVTIDPPDRIECSLESRIIGQAIVRSLLNKREREKEREGGKSMSDLRGNSYEEIVNGESSPKPNNFDHSDDNKQDILQVSKDNRGFEESCESNRESIAINGEVSPLSSDFSIVPSDHSPAASEFSSIYSAPPVLKNALIPDIESQISDFPNQTVRDWKTCNSLPSSRQSSPKFVRDWKSKAQKITRKPDPELTNIRESLCSGDLFRLEQRKSSELRITINGHDRHHETFPRRLPKQYKSLDSSFKIHESENCPRGHKQDRSPEPHLNNSRKHRWKDHMQTDSNFNTYDSDIYQRHSQDQSGPPNLYFDTRDSQPSQRCFKKKIGRLHST